MSDPNHEAMSAEELVGYYKRLQMDIDVLELSIASEVTAKKAVQEQIVTLLDHMLARNGATSIKTSVGTAVRTTRKFYRAVDSYAFKKWAADNDMWDSFTVSPTPDFVKSYEAEYGKLPPGVGVHATSATTIRKS
jgi:hypothetical protein